MEAGSFEPGVVKLQNICSKERCNPPHTHFHLLLHLVTVSEFWLFHFFLICSHAFTQTRTTLTHTITYLNSSENKKQGSLMEVKLLGGRLLKNSIFTQSESVIPQVTY